MESVHGVCENVVAMHVRLVILAKVSVCYSDSKLLKVIVYCSTEHANLLCLWSKHSLLLVSSVQAFLVVSAMWTPSQRASYASPGDGAADSGESSSSRLRREPEAMPFDGAADSGESYSSRVTRFLQAQPFQFSYRVERSVAAQPLGLAVHCLFGGDCVVAAIAADGLVAATNAKRSKVEGMERQILYRGDLIQSVNQCHQDHESVLAKLQDPNVGDLWMWIQRKRGGPASGKPDAITNILKQGGLLQAVKEYNPVESEPEKGYLEVQRGTMAIGRPNLYTDTGRPPPPQPPPQPKPRPNPPPTTTPTTGGGVYLRCSQVRVYGDTEFTGYAANAYGKYIFAELYRPTEAQKSDGWRGWLPIDILTVADA